MLFLPGFGQANRPRIREPSEFLPVPDHHSLLNVAILADSRFKKQNLKERPKGPERSRESIQITRKIGFEGWGGKNRSNSCRQYMISCIFDLFYPHLPKPTKFDPVLADVDVFAVSVSLGLLLESHCEKNG